MLSLAFLNYPWEVRSLRSLDGGLTLKKLSEQQGCGKNQAGNIVTRVISAVSQATQYSAVRHGQSAWHIEASTWYRVLDYW